MLRFSEYHHYEPDSRILVISDPEDFQLYRLRDRFHFSGLLFPYPVTAEAVATAKFCATTKLIAKRQFITRDGNFEEIDVEDEPDLRPLQRIAANLQFLFTKACGQNSRTSLRINSNYPIKPHQHGTALTLSILESGTICYDSNNRAYAIPPHHAFICEDIPHKAPQNFPANAPRCNFVVIQETPAYT